jgi:hypothetical protein
MAYAFVAGSDQSITGPIPNEALPVTIVAWFNRSTSSGTGPLVTLMNSGAETYQSLYTTGSSALRVQTISGGTGFNVATSPWAQNVWSHGAGKFASASSRTVIIDGGGAQTNTSTRFAPFDELRIATYGNTSPLHLSGRLSEVAVWNADLTSDEIVSLAKGFKSYRIRPQSLLYYVPLVREIQELRSGITLTANNAPTLFAHPRVY